MKNLSVVFAVPSVFVMKDSNTMLVPSMVLTTLAICILTTFVPQLMPLWTQTPPVPRK